MSYHRAVCALVLSAAVAAGWSEAAARTATSPITTVSSALLDGPGGRKLGHCFLQQGIAAPQVPATGQSTTLRAPAGKVVTRVSLKAGAGCFFTPAGASGTWTHEAGGAVCYVVEGIGTPAVIVKRVSNGPSCKGLGMLQTLSAAPAPAGDNGGGGSGGSDSGSGDNGGDTGGGGTPGLGSLVVCTATTTPVADLALGISVSTRYQEIALLEVPIGTCSQPMYFEEGWYIVAQGLPEGFTLNDVSTDPSGRIVSVEAMYGQATVQVLTGSTTKLTFTNQAQ